MNLLTESPLDSHRFGLRVMRGHLTPPVEARALAREISDAACDVAIVRVPVGNPRALEALPRLGLPIRHADTLVYYVCDLERHVPAALRNRDLAFDLARAEDLESLGPIVAATFNGYVSHYHANPVFPADAVLAGYREWAQDHAAGEGRQLWVARRAGVIVAFAACETHGDTAEGVLYGVAPEAAGGGLYGDLIRHTQSVARAAGCRRMKVSTQVGNFAVQKVWAREGFHMDRAFDTWHVDALLSCGEVAHDADVMFDAADIRRFADTTGDRNPVHVDAAAAARAGFEAPIAHGVRIAAEVSRLLGMEDPGPGTIIRHLDLAFLRPVLTGRTYRLVSRFARRPTPASAGLAVTTLRHPEDGVCAIARADLVLRVPA